MSNSSGMADPFSASASVAAAANPHASHYYGSVSMGLISSPSLETLGLSTSGNILNNGTHSGASNGKFSFILFK